MLNKINPNIKYGPLPKDWVKYKGHYRNGGKVVLKYTVGQTEVLESPLYEEHNDVQAYSRSLNIAEVSSPITMMVLKGNNSVKLLGEETSSAKKPTAKFKDGLNVVTQRSESDWNSLAMGAPSKTDTAHKKKILFTKAKNLAAPHAQAGATGNTLPRLTNGKSPKNGDDTKNSTWFDLKAYEFILDLDAKTDIARINIYSWHNSDRAPQRYTLYGSADAKSWTKIATVDTLNTSAMARPGCVGSSRFSTPCIRRGSLFSKSNSTDKSYERC